MTSLSLPKRPRGRPTTEQGARFDRDLDAWCAAIQEIQCTLDFPISSRGWCYVLEKGGLRKGDFDLGQELINKCRKSGRLPLNICAEDDSRGVEGLEDIDDDDVEGEASFIIDYVDRAHQSYNPISFWETQDKYVEVLTEKIDLKSFFSRVCSEFKVPITNASGWNDLNSRTAIMRRFSKWEKRGKQCVLLYCGDHDPGGLQISGFLRSNFNDMAGAVGWSPGNLTIDRFGLDYEFIEEQGLTWIDNLETSNGKFPFAGSYRSGQNHHGRADGQ
jgi:hypothetical protein